ncbi:MAG: acetoin utilization protein AcuC [Bacillota bacterium]|nr:MAG: acetoin utilization protein AcuC [Bacillota bacterium]
MGGRVAFLWHDGLVAYRFSDTHPLNPMRLVATLDLLRATGLLQPSDIVPFGPASTGDLALVHDRRYIAAVQRFSAPQAALSPSEQREALAFGLGTADNPLFPGMHDAAALVVGGALRAAELVMSGTVDHAVHLGGGLHHALPDRAAGFCIYNDPAVAIAHIRKTGARVAYVDIDAHHGDGVQWIFYEDPDVLTISIHESGHYLFPGTGHEHERGRGPGWGTAINIPLAPGTGDDSWLRCFEAVVPPALRAFRPDVLVTQHGCDAHLWDPLTHLSLSLGALTRAAAILHRLAHELCEGRWIVLGGGGYDLLRVVPRAWTSLWAEVAGRLVPDALPGPWLERWAKVSPRALPTTLADDPAAFPAGPEQLAAARANEALLDRLLRSLSLLPT